MATVMFDYSYSLLFFYITNYYSVKMAHSPSWECLTQIYENIIEKSFPLVRVEGEGLADYNLDC